MSESARERFEKQRDQLQRLIDEKATRQTRFGEFIRPMIALESSPAHGELAPRSSKFGGAPDVPQGFGWPHWEGNPLAFIAQINLEEVALFDAQNRLPASGLLSFWVNELAHLDDMGDERIGRLDDGQLGSSWRVFWFEGQTQPLASPPTGPRTVPVGADQLQFFVEVPLSFGVSSSFPSGSSAEFYPEEPLRDEDYLADELREMMPPPGHQMFGSPDSIQDDVRYECAPQWNKFLASPEARELGLSPEHDQTDWPDWELLLQLNGDTNARMDWGDAGAIYFLIRRADLEARRFERAWFVFQCC